MAQKTLLEWQTTFPDKATLIHRLDHKYSESSLSMRNAKGRDRAVCRTLHEVASECGVYLIFAHLTRSEQGPEGDWYDHKYGDDGDDEKTYNDLKTLYSFDGKPIGSGDMPEDEEILDLNKVSEGDPDSEEEGEFFGNEAAETTLRYHNTVAILVKKKSVHRYMGQATQHSSSRNLYTENMVQMVVDDMVRFMKDQTANEHARPPVLEVIRKALGSGGSSKVLTPMAVYGALKLEDSTLYQSAMTAAAKSACEFFEERFADNTGSIEWNKWVGNAAETKTVSDVQDIIHNFSPVFEIEAVRDLFVKWGESKLSDKFETQASFGISEHLFFVKTIGEKHDNNDWLMSRYGDSFLAYSINLSLVGSVANCGLVSYSLIPALASRGTRELIYGVLRSVFIKKDPAEFAIVKEFFLNIFTRLLLEGADMHAKPAVGGPPTHIATPCLGPPRDFVALVDQCLTLGLGEKARELLEACSNQRVWTKAEWHPKKVGGDVVSQLLQPIIKVLKENAIPATQGVKDLFQVILRDGLHAIVPRNPPKRRGWTHKPRPCPKNYGGLGHKCRDCEAMNAFLLAPDQNVWRYQAGKPTRDHLEDQLRANSSGSGYDFGSRTQCFNISTEKTPRTHTMVVEKTRREFADAVESWQQSALALDSQLVPLRNEMVAEMLGDEAYQELVQVENLRAQIAASGGSIPTGMKRAVDETAAVERHDVKRA
ncbi:2OG-Fe oxygenase family protein [Colletotrichum incanum]|nr:2OG-Fe oxygenase family protein [Colletotrichum incanum]